MSVSPPTTWTEPTPSPLLLLLGEGTEAETERGVECPGVLPRASDPGLLARARMAKAELGDRVFVLGHHYQRDEVIQFADVTGDSFKLAREAAARSESEYIVFCGVHFMAESADILTGDHQQVVLPDLAAGCSMADMATLAEVEAAWSAIAAAGLEQSTIPLTYMNSSAAIKSFTGRHGGSICTSSNARRSLEWAFDQADRVLFLPDQHLGRNTAVLQMGLSPADCVVFDPRKPGGGVSRDALRQAKLILWRGHCSVHARFTVDRVQKIRRQVPDVTVIVHPECAYEVAANADFIGSTENIIKAVNAAPAGAALAIGTELNLVRRLATQHPDKRVMFLDSSVCFCSTMNRIDLPHLTWALESLVEGRVVNRISVNAETARWSTVALERMLALPGS
ncbi:MAG: quinolinate synthase NadA [Candidatus Nanopelagicales bacterium]|nr:quinolinate synthase NadA [Candidatus Nanopelagicales bacterium]